MNADAHEQMERLHATKASRPTDGIYLEHYFRYRFAKEYVAGRDVLDCACGTGYGTFALAEKARDVLGVDNSSEALAVTGTQWTSSNIRYRLLDVRDLAGLHRSFDVIVSFETIEHLEDPSHFLSAVENRLKPNGVFIVSTPNRDAYRLDAVSNRFHLNEFTSREFERALSMFFSDIELFGQVRLERELQLQNRPSRWYSGIKATIVEAIIGNRMIYAAYLQRMKRRFAVVAARDIDQYRYLVAVCRKRRP
jgi:SAM-dependent methyltransferase